MSLWGHHVLAEDVLEGDVLGKDIKSPCGHRVLDGDVIDRDILLGKDIMSTHGRPQADVPVEDIYVCFYFCPFVLTVGQVQKKWPQTVYSI